MEKNTEKMIRTMAMWNGQKDEESNLEYKLIELAETQYKTCKNPNWNWDKFDYRIVEKEMVTIEEFEGDAYEPYDEDDSFEIGSLVGKGLVCKCCGDVSLVTKLINEFRMNEDDDEEDFFPVVIIDETPYDLIELFNSFTFVDGSPCGKLI